jgi:uncharacterized protein YlxW (UPF0749 family)
VRILRMGPSRRSEASIAPRLLTAAVFAAAGLMFWLSFDTAEGTNLRTDDSMLRLSDLIQEKNHRNQELDKDLSTVHKQVDGLTKQDSASPKAGRDLAEARGQAGIEPLTGPSVSVTLDDAPPDGHALIPDVPKPSPDDLVIHQQDLQAVVNALWNGGAKGIKVMDQRLIATSAVRCVGNTLILQGRVYSPPYTITAVGDQDALHKAVNGDPAIENYLEYVQAYGLGWKVQDHKKTTLPGYSGTVDLHYAQPGNS